MNLSDSLRRGLAAGLVAGLLAGLFALLVGEVPVREAIRLEEQAAAAAPADDPAVDQPPLVDRPTQQLLLPVATAVVGTAFGGLFGLAWVAARRRIRDRSEWRASLKFGAAVWAAVSLFPSLLYPANPPAVGDPGTIGSRSTWYVVALGVGVAIAAAGWWLAIRLRERGVDEAPRQLTVAAGIVVAAAVAFVVLPANTDPILIPASLLWEFRLASMATQLILWVGIAAGFGWLNDRAAARRVAAGLAVA